MLRILKNQNNKEKNNDFVYVIKSGLPNLKNDIKKMSDDEIKIKQPDRVVDIVEEILEFNEQNPEGQRLKILTPDEMVSRLSISLAQLKVRNSSERIKMK